MKHLITTDVDTFNKYKEEFTPKNTVLIIANKFDGYASFGSAYQRYEMLHDYLIHRKTGGGKKSERQYRTDLIRWICYSFFDDLQTIVNRFISGKYNIVIVEEADGTGAAEDIAYILRTLYDIKSFRLSKKFMDNRKEYRSHKNSQKLVGKHNILKFVRL